MEKLIQKIEGIIDNQVSQFEDAPIKTSLRLLFYYWIFKKIYAIVKEA